MKRSKPQPSRRSRRKYALGLLLGLAASGGMLVPQESLGCDLCGAESIVGCDSCDSCDSCVAKPRKKLGNPIFSTLDAIAGTVEGIMGFDKCGTSGCDSGLCDSGCDDGCDAAMMSELMMPSPPSYTPDSYQVVPHAPAVISPAPRMAPRAVPVVPAPSMSTPRVVSPAPRMAQPRMRMTEPMIMTPRATDTSPRMYDSVPREAAPRTTAPRTTTPRETAPRVTAPRDTAPRNTAPRDAEPVDRLPNIQPEPDVLPDMPTPDTAPRNTAPRNTAPRNTAPRNTAPRNTTPRNTAPRTTPPADDGGGSLFDTLGTDPFGDDEVRALPKPYRSVRPSNYRMPNQRRTNAQPSAAPMQMRLNQPQSRQPNWQMPQPRGLDRSSSYHPTTRVPSSYHASSSNVRHASGTKRGAGTRNTRQVSHQHNQSSRAASNQLHRYPAQPQLKAAPRSSMQPQYPARRTSGQRHSNAIYSSYGHTTNR